MVKKLSFIEHLCIPNFQQIKFSLRPRRRHLFKQNVGIKALNNFELVPLRYMKRLLFAFWVNLLT